MLGLAARVWRRAELAGAAAGALLKLRAAGIDAEDDDAGRHRPRVTPAKPRSAPYGRRCMERRPVSFAYRAAGRTAPQRARCSRGGW